MSYYGNNYPEIDEVVFVTISSFTDHGIYCTLVEYDNKEGFLANTELDKKIYYERKKYFNFKKIYPMIVMDINFDKGYIDLSHKRIKSDERDKYIKYFEYISKMYRLTEEFSKISKLAVTDLLPLTMWNFMKKDDIENSQKKFRAILQKPDEFIEKAKEIYPSESSDFLDNLASRISSTTLTIHQQFDLIVYCENAIDEIKKILDFPELKKNIKIEYVNSPTYRFVVECKFEDDRNDLIDKYIEIHKQKIHNKECQHCDLVKLGNDLFVDDINKYIELLKEKIKGKNIHFEIGDKLLIKEREMTIKYLPKSEVIEKKKDKIYLNKEDYKKNEEEDYKEDDYKEDE
jgi:translation initiation factor 2 subunit 1